MPALSGNLGPLKSSIICLNLATLTFHGFLPLLWGRSQASVFCHIGPQRFMEQHTLGLRHTLFDVVDRRRAKQGCLHSLYITLFLVLSPCSCIHSTAKPPSVKAGPCDYIRYNPAVSNVGYRVTRYTLMSMSYRFKRHTSARTDVLKVKGLSVLKQTNTHFLRRDSSRSFRILSPCGDAR